ncbi:hypothetical protein DP939_40280 [Spongiactinospora rosea]|uniref:Uncharacterized protein n=1 Tax=Spongiactinospora rosea TaxID=2248750 RepID=A0A366LKP8_9ACTN|nr:hypothetical protein [Spongiactinospora rosea]RBQ14505.1 hypothetical protein DP939_40280 [Spongiactinospora rosea]
MGHPPVVIDVAAGARRKAVIGGSVSGVVGLIAIVSVFTGQVLGGQATYVTGFIIGLVFLLIGLLPVIAWRKLTRPRKLVFDMGGVRWDDPQGKPWAVPWHDLSAVVISRSKQPRVQPSDYVLRKIMVRLDLHPADPAFRGRHPEMEHLWEFHRVKNGYRLPLGSSPAYIPIIEGAMRAFAPGLYQGIRDEGFVGGLV